MTDERLYNHLPDTLRIHVQTLLDAMQQDVDHQLTPWQRLPLYETISQLPPLLARRMHGWLAILAARKVLPIWAEILPVLVQAEAGKPYLGASVSAEKAYQWLNKPAEFVAVATDFLGGRIDQAALETEEHMGYMWMGEPPHAELFQASTWMAATAAYGTLEVIGGNWARPQWFFLGRTLASELRDEDYDIDAGDPTGAAVCAYAWYQQPIDPPLPGTKPVALTEYPERCREFWIWWLVEAIPEAWRLTNTSEI